MLALFCLLMACLTAALALVISAFSLFNPAADDSKSIEDWTLPSNPASEEGRRES